MDVNQSKTKQNWKRNYNEHAKLRANEKSATQNN